MTEVAALDKHACPACGAMANWNAAQKALVCPYCGAVSPVELASDGSIIKEHDLVAALRAVPEEKKGWEADRVSVQCQSCKAITLFEPGRVAQSCEFCGSPTIIPQSAVRAPIVPESVLPFVVAETKVREDLRRWYGSRWFAPNRLKNAALTDKVHGLYIPYWTFDAQVAAQWTAEAGHYYYVTERRGKKTEQVRKVRWEPRRRLARSLLRRRAGAGDARRSARSADERAGRRQSSPPARAGRPRRAFRSPADGTPRRRSVMILPSVWLVSSGARRATGSRA